MTGDPSTCTVVLEVHSGNVKFIQTKDSKRVGDMAVYLKTWRRSTVGGVVQKAVGIANGRLYSFLALKHSNGYMLSRFTLDIASLIITLRSWTSSLEASSILMLPAEWIHYLH
jgi:hypothetical protein